LGTITAADPPPASQRSGTSCDLRECTLGETLEPGARQQAALPAAKYAARHEGRPAPADTRIADNRTNLAGREPAIPRNQLGGCVT
jgi:hypothetical protein